jgi:capsular polysaccharide biosynthesis protein
MIDSIYLPDRGSHNLFHFLILMIPNLMYLEFKPKFIYINLKNPYFNNNHNFIKEAFSLIYPSSEVIHSDYCPKDVLSLNFISEPFSRIKCNYDKNLYEYVKNLFIPIINKNSYNYEKFDRIYISRNDSNCRKILNEEEFIEKLKKYNFKILTLTNKTLLEQFILFNNAKIIISPHGAALTNIIFCNTDVQIFEINTEIMTKLEHFSEIADFLNLSHKRLIGKPALSNSNSFDSNIIIENINFDEIINKISN